MAISEPEEDSYSNEFGTEDIQRNDDRICVQVDFICKLQLGCVACVK